MSVEAVDNVDVIVVGSGPSAVNAASPLVEAGLRVRMLDVGHRDTTYADLIPPGPFSELRRTDRAQHRYFLGDRFEGIEFDHESVGARLTPPRQYVCRDSERLAPVSSTTFAPLQSFAEGGLGSAWGAGSPPFSEVDLADFPISHADLAPHYEVVAERIGVSGARDDLLPFLGAPRAMQPPVAVDSNGESILRRYAAHRGAMQRSGIYVGHPRLAMLSQPHRGRDGNPRWDMDLWSDAGKSVYRPRWTLEELRRSAGFSFVGRRMVRSFAEQGDGGVVVEAVDLETGTAESHRARAVVLAAGTLGTTRIVLRSLRAHGRRVPILCNPHSYIALLNLGLLGKSVRDARHSLPQACLIHAPGGAAHPFTIGHIYSYRSLLLFRLIKDAALPHPEGLEIMRHLSPSFGVLLIQHRDRPTPAKHATLVPRPGGDDQLAIEYGMSAAEQQEIDDVERAVARGLFRLRCVRLRTIRPGHASSFHYAGTLPMSAGGEELTTDRDGRLARTRGVYVADGSVFPSLPSKGLTFTMMANADRIGTRLARTLQS